MESNFLYIYGNEDNKFIRFLLDGIEEQGIRYKVFSLEDARHVNLKKIPFNMMVEIDDWEIKFKSIDFQEETNFKVRIDNKKMAKEFGLDIGRYIKRIPIKGDWYEGFRLS